MGGKYMKPSKKAEILVCNNEFLLLKFDKTSFTYGSYPQPKKIVVVYQPLNKVIGTSYTNYVEIDLKKDFKEVFAHINKSSIRTIIIEFYGIWDDKKKDKDSSETEMRFVQTLQLQDKPNLHGLDLSAENIKETKIEALRAKISSYNNQYNFKKINILICGLTNSGKSSLINSFDHCLNKSSSQIAQIYTNLAGQTGERTTEDFQEKSLIHPWLSVWDSPGIQLHSIFEDENFMSISKIWKNMKLNDLCKNTKFVTPFNLAPKEDQIKTNIDQLQPIENQIHSVIFVWNLENSNSILLYYSLINILILI